MRAFVIGLVVAVGCNLILAVWLWARARERSAEWAFMPGTALLAAGMLAGWLPRVLWPMGDAVQIAGAIAGLGLMTVSVLVTLRRRGMIGQAEHQARVAEFPEPIRKAHRHSSKHREELLASQQCGCFYCEAIYSPSEISEWTDDRQTALCARCGIDSVIGTESGFPITAEFLGEMNRFWF